MSKLDLRSFQQEISERLAVARRSGGEPPRLAFISAGQRYALPLVEISEVAPLGDVRSVPGGQPWFLGLTNIRGSVLALSHLGALLHAAAPARTQASRVLVLGGEFSRLRAGLLVDSVLGLRTFTKAADDAASTTGLDEQGNAWGLLHISTLLTTTHFLEVYDHAEAVAA